MGFLLDRLSKTSSKDAMHSSVFGQAQNEGAFGTTSVQGFDQRRNIDQNRQTIRKYGEAQVVNEVGRKEKINSIHEKNIGGEMSNSASNGGTQQGSSDYGSTRQGVADRPGFGARCGAKPQPAASTNMGMRPLPGARVAPSAGVASRSPARRNPGIFR